MKTRANPTTLLILLFSLVALGLKLVMAWHAPVGPDEFQHLHSAWCVANGQTPYVDFFEHHPPFIYYLLWPVFQFLEPGFNLILAARTLMVVLNAAIVFATYELARSSLGRRMAQYAVLLLLSDVLFFEFGFWVITDVPAVLLTLASAWCLIRAGRTETARWFFAASALLGMAVFFTPKVICLGLGVAIWFLIYLVRSENREQLSKRLGMAASFLGGAVVPLGLLLFLIGPGSWPAFWDQNVTLNLSWKARHSPLPHVRHMLVTNGPLWIAAGFGLLGMIHRMIARPDTFRRSGPVTLSFASLVFGAIVLPVVWQEYFVGLVPFGVIAAGYGLHRLATHLSLDGKFRHAAQTNRWLASGSIVLSLILVCALGYNFLRVGNMLSLISVLQGIVLVALTLFVVWFAGRQGQRGRVGLAAVAAMLALPVLVQCHLTRTANNFEHRQAIDFVLARTGPNDFVFDGYMGYGLFRPHAYKWWFLHDETQLMLSEHERGQAIVEALSRHRPKIVLYDCWVEALEPVVHKYIRSHYAPTAMNQIWIAVDSTQHDGASLQQSLLTTIATSDGS